MTLAVNSTIIATQRQTYSGVYQICRHVHQPLHNSEGKKYVISDRNFPKALFSFKFSSLQWAYRCFTTFDLVAICTKHHRCVLITPAAASHQPQTFNPPQLSSRKPYPTTQFQFHKKNFKKSTDLHNTFPSGIYSDSPIQSSTFANAKNCRSSPR